MNVILERITVLGYLLSLVLIRWVLIAKNRQPVSSVAWIMAIITLPYLGGLLFLLFGINRVDAGQPANDRRRDSSANTCRPFRSISSFRANW